MKIKAEIDSSIHPSMQNDFLLYGSKFIVQFHFTMRELPITTPIHIYYCFMTCLKLCSMLYLIIVCRRSLSHFCSITWHNQELLGRGASWLSYQIGNSYPICCPLSHLGLFFFNVSSLQASFSCWISAFCIIILADALDSICRLNPILWFPAHISNLSTLLFISSHSVLAGVSHTFQF